MDKPNIDSQLFDGFRFSLADGIKHAEQLGQGLLHYSSDRIRNEARKMITISSWLKELRELKKLSEPAQVNYEWDGYADGCPVVDFASCPNCGYGIEEDSENWKCSYCPHCGQMLKWEAEMPPAEPEDKNSSENPNKWISCSERLPEEKDVGIIQKRFFGTTKMSDRVIATVEVKGERMTEIACTRDGAWDWKMKHEFPDYKIIAWMPLPKPYEAL